MPFISGNVSENRQIIIGVKIAPFAQQVPFDANKLQEYRALIDTGATSTCISEKVVSDLNLQSTGLSKVNTASGVAIQQQYIFAVQVPMQNGTPIFSTQGTVMPVTSDKFDVLLGMDVLVRGSLKVDFDGHFSLYL